ncbi:hypothetical protein LAZ67_1008426 [Cordylochernes scorpioides]|uniref:Uncharacterized protein n=1 Tax=Cordylochernes scorpioides TaxID=51811 RepID=A0ABY6K015_9ARAC|nr:hypothetical protein LAZ67_1008426 [Cordylochernes scorpioides]
MDDLLPVDQVGNGQCWKMFSRHNGEMIMIELIIGIYIRVFFDLSSLLVGSNKRLFFYLSSPVACDSYRDKWWRLGTDSITDTSVRRNRRLVGLEPRFDIDEKNSPIRKISMSAGVNTGVKILANI